MRPMPKTNIETAMKTVAQLEFPRGLHERIMRRVWFTKLRTPIAIIGSLFFINFAVIIWRLWVHLGENEGYYLLRTILEDLEWDQGSLRFAWSEIVDIVPLSLIVGIVVNVALLLYIYRVFGLIKKNATKVEFPTFNH